jgi:hypothetical protein
MEKKIFCQWTGLSSKEPNQQSISGRVRPHPLSWTTSLKCILNNFFTVIIVSEQHKNPAHLGIIFSVVLYLFTVISSTNLNADLDAI